MKKYLFFAFLGKGTSRGNLTITGVGEINLMFVLLLLFFSLTQYLSSFDYVFILVT